MKSEVLRVLFGIPRYFVEVQVLDVSMLKVFWNRSASPLEDYTRKHTGQADSIIRDCGFFAACSDEVFPDNIQC